MMKIPSSPTLSELPAFAPLIPRPTKMLRYVIVASAIVFVLLFQTSRRATWPAVPEVKRIRPDVLVASANITSNLSMIAEKSLTPQKLWTTVRTHDTTLHSRIGKVTALFYEEISLKSQAYEAALLSHTEHDREFGYHHFVLRRSIIRGLWPKLAYILSVLVAELEKAPAERLDWLFWHDADVVLVNRHIPLEIFIPPEPQWSHLNFIASNDLNGLNDGIFLLRVCEWSVYFMSAGLSWQSYNRGSLRYGEQTALELLTRQDLWKRQTMHVPQRWFNAYHHYGVDDSVPPEWEWKNAYIEPGDLLVHLPGSGDSRSRLIKDWVGRVANDRDRYVVPLRTTSYNQEIQDFWANDAMHEEENQVVYWRRFHAINDVGRLADDRMASEVKRVIAAMPNGTPKADIDKAVREVEARHKAQKIIDIRAVYEARKNGMEQDSIAAV